MATRDAKFTISAEDRFSRTFSTLKNDLAASQARMTALGTAAGAVNGALGRIVFPALAGVGLVSGIKQLAQDLDNLNDASDATGSTVENLSALERVARRNGESLDVVSTGLLKLNLALKEADPNSPASKALQAIGLSAKELRQLDPSVAIQRVAQALDGFQDGPEKARIILELFGKSTRQVAAFLKDLAESGELVATVTRKQADEAERFNKNLAELSTNATQAGRSLLSDLLPSLNGLFERARIAKDVFGGLFAGLAANAGVDDAAAGVERYTQKLDELKKEQKALVEQGPTLKAFVFGQRDIDGEIGKAEKLLDFYQRAAGQLKTFAGAGRGFVNPDAAAPRPKAPDIGDGKKAQVTEAQRLVESLEKQIQAEQRLTEEERVRLGIEQKIYDGMTPKLEARALATAKFIDQLKLVNKELEREAGFQKLLLDKRQGDINEGLSLLEQTPSGQRDRLNRQADSVLSVSRANPDDEGIQRRALEALGNLRKQMDDLNKPVEGVRSEFDKLADTIEKTMDRSTDAVLDFIVDGKGGFGSLFSSFRRDVLRQLIEEPLRDSMKSAVALIRSELGKLQQGGGESLFGGILSFFRGLFSTGGGAGGGNGFGIGYTGAANGGPVRAGQLVRWQESGREWFVPGSDGTVVNPGQQKAMMGGSQNVFAPVVNVNGDVGPQTVALINGLLAKQQAAWMRSMRTGGAMAVG